MKYKQVLNMVRDETSLQFFLLKHKVDWNERYETPAGNAWHGRPRRRKPRRLHRPPAESEFLEWKSTFPFYKPQTKKDVGKQILSSL